MVVSNGPWQLSLNGASQTITPLRRVGSPDLTFDHNADIERRIRREVPAHAHNPYTCRRGFVSEAHQDHLWMEAPAAVPLRVRLLPQPSPAS